MKSCARNFYIITKKKCQPVQDNNNLIYTQKKLLHNFSKTNLYM